MKKKIVYSSQKLEITVLKQQEQRQTTVENYTKMSLIRTLQSKYDPIKGINLEP